MYQCGCRCVLFGDVQYTLHICTGSVSYTHLDVYKRQTVPCTVVSSARFAMPSRFKILYMLFSFSALCIFAKFFTCFLEIFYFQNNNYFFHLCPDFSLYFPGLSRNIVSLFGVIFSIHFTFLLLNCSEIQLSLIHI